MHLRAGAGSSPEGLESACARLREGIALYLEDLLIKRKLIDDVSATYFEGRPLVFKSLDENLNQQIDATEALASQADSLTAILGDTVPDTTGKSGKQGPAAPLDLEAMHARAEAEAEKLRNIFVSVAQAKGLRPKGAVVKAQQLVKASLQDYLTWVLALPVYYDREIGRRSLHDGLDQAEFADQLGLDWISFSEHHYSTISVAPHPALAATAIVTRVRLPRRAVHENLRPLQEKAKQGATLAKISHS